MHHFEVLQRLLRVRLDMRRYKDHSTTSGWSDRAAGKDARRDLCGTNLPV